MTAAELKNRLLKTVGLEIPGTAPAHMVDSVRNAVNHAFQVLWLDVPRDRRVAYTRRLDTYTVPAGTDSVTLPAGVQAVLPPVRVLPLKTSLMVASHKSEVESYGLLRGGLTGETTNSVPRVYYVDSVHQAQSNAMSIRLILAPTPAVETGLLVEVEVLAPSFGAGDFCGSSTPLVPIPNDYAESMLLPIAAYHLATQSRWFKAADLLPVIEAEYERAKLRAGIVDPTPTAASQSVKPADR
jgi:hypothetical protein